MPPGPSQPPQVNRRGFLKQASLALSGVIAVALGWPLVGALAGPIYRRQRLDFAKVKPVGTLPDGEPMELSFPQIVQDAYLRKTVHRNVWVVKHSATDVTVFSPICPHLGCRYDWFPALQHFVCPCHGSVFSIAGTVLGGPAPRPLDTLKHHITDGELYVEWERFQSGIARKVRV